MCPLDPFREKSDIIPDRIINTSRDDKKVNVSVTVDLPRVATVGYVVTDLSEVEFIANNQFWRDSINLERLARCPRSLVSRAALLRSDKRAFTVGLQLSTCGFSLDILYSGVLFPLLVMVLNIAVNKKLARDGERIQFQIDVHDQDVNKILDDFEKGIFGKGDDGVNLLIRYLQMKKHDIRITASNVYVIDRVVEFYARSIVRTIRKN